MPQLEDFDFVEMVNQSEDAGACSGWINRLRRYQSMEEMMDAYPDSKQAFIYAWYAKYVLNDRWPEAEEVIERTDNLHGYRQLKRRRVNGHAITDHEPSPKAPPRRQRGRIDGEPVRGPSS